MSTSESDQVFVRLFSSAEPLAKPRDGALLESNRLPHVREASATIVNFLWQPPLARRIVGHEPFSLEAKMLATSLSLLAGAVVAATPVTPLPWFDFNDYPMKAFEKKAEGVTRFELLVAPDGSVTNCTVTESAGRDDLDRTTCFLATKRVRFNPARGPDGQPVYGIHRSQAIWVLPERTIPANPGPDLEVSLNKLPAGTAEPPVVKVAYAIDSQGRISSCTPMPSSLKQPEVLFEVGCREVLDKMGGKPVVGPSGNPVPAVRTAAVKFTVGS